MVATTAFVLAFILAGLGVVFMAFSGSGGRRRGGPNRTARKWALVAIGAVTIAFGVAIPAVSIAVNADEQSKSAPGGLELNATQQRGREIFARNCGTCHTMRASNSVGRVGPNLDVMRPPKALTLDAIEKGRARGMGQMPSQLVDGEDAEAVAEFIEAAAGR